MIDIFAWIVLLILVASGIAIFFIAGSLPGHIAKSRGHPWAQAVTVAGWVTLICGFALWPVALIWAYVVILFILVKTKIVPFNLFWKCSPLIVLLLLMFGLFIPMGWGAPQGPAMVVRNSVQIVPNVAGEVTDVAVVANKPLKAGDVLFKI